MSHVVTIKTEVRDAGVVPCGAESWGVSGQAGLPFVQQGSERLCRPLTSGITEQTSMEGSGKGSLGGALAP